jgi:hypothetical protein
MTFRNFVYAPKKWTKRMRAEEEPWGQKCLKRKGILLNATVTKSELSEEAFQSVVFMSTGLTLAGARSHFTFVDRLVDTPIWRSDHRGKPDTAHKRDKLFTVELLIIFSETERSLHVSSIFHVWVNRYIKSVLPLSWNIPIHETIQEM